MDEARLNAFAERRLGTGATAVHRLSGGASMESWRFTSADKDYVLRRLPEGASADAAINGLPLAIEAEVLRAARAHGVRAPEIVTGLLKEDGLGEGYLMRAIDGETLPHRILGNPDYDTATLARDAATQLAQIHAVPPAAVPLDAAKPTQARLAELRDLKVRLAVDSPTFDLALDWLEANLPTDIEPRLLHGDFRMGNLMVTPDGIAGVLDWELTHLGDPAQDIGFLCAPSWRFGYWEREVGGFGDLENFLSAYREAGGEDISPDRVRFWEVYSSLWWGLVCVQMVELWRSGTVRTLERPVIGTRVSETEIDLLLLLDAGDQPKFDFPSPETSNVKGATEPQELLQALGEWTGNLIDSASGHAKFEARIARNALGIVERHLTHGPAPEVTDLISLRKNVMHRVRIEQPRYAGLRVAEERWTL